MLLGSFCSHINALVAQNSSNCRQIFSYQASILIFSFKGSHSALHSASITAVMYAISHYTGPHYNSTGLDMVMASEFQCIGEQFSQVYNRCSLK